VEDDFIMTEVEESDDKLLRLVWSRPRKTDDTATLVVSLIGILGSETAMYLGNRAGSRIRLGLRRIIFDLSNLGHVSEGGIGIFGLISDELRLVDGRIVLMGLRCKSTRYSNFWR
jgi:anti-anti-sigma regulatory factor